MLYTAYTVDAQHLPRSFNVKFRESEIEIDKNSKVSNVCNSDSEDSDSIDSGIGRAAVARTVQKKSVRARKY